MARSLRSNGCAARGIAVDGELAFLRTFVTAQVVFLFVLSCNAYQGVPIAAVILGVVATIVHVLTRDTPYGRYLYAIGGNEEAAVVSGVPVTRVVIAAFGIIGVVTALTGFLQTAYAGASTTTVGTNLELDAIAACVIGGTSLKGGRGTVGGVLMGALIVTAPDQRHDAAELRARGQEHHPRRDPCRRRVGGRAAGKAMIGLPFPVIRKRQPETSYTLSAMPTDDRPSSLSFPIDPNRDHGQGPWVGAGSAGRVRRL